MEEPYTPHAAELVLESYRVSGEISGPSEPCRFVDLLNSLNSGFVLVRDAQLDDPILHEHPASHHDIVQVHLPAILFAIPIGDGLRYEDPLETVEKQVVGCTMVVPGYEIVGNIHLRLGLIAGETPLIGLKHFIAMTDVRITSVLNRSRMWKTDLVCVNLARTIVFAPHRKLASVV